MEGLESNCIAAHRGAERARWQWTVWAPAAAALIAILMAPALRPPRTAGAAGPPSSFSVPEDKVVLLVPMGHHQEHDVDFLATGLEARLGVRVALAPPQPTPASAYQRRTGQYSATRVMDALFLSAPPESWRVVAVTSADLTSDDVDMVYGFASSRDRVAVISTWRFRRDLASDSLRRRATARDQLIRAAVHEVAHTSGLPHCGSSGCLMGAISHRDQITPATALCERCAGTLAERLALPRDHRAERVERGDGLLARGYPADALDLYLRSMPPGDEPSAPHDNRLGAALLSLELVAEGERLLRRAVATDPGYAPAHYNLALVEAYAGNPEAALESLRRGMDLDPDATSRHGFAARFYLDAIEDPGSALIEYRDFRDAGGSDGYLDARLSPLDSPDVFVFTAEEAEVIVGRR